MDLSKLTSGTTIPDINSMKNELNDISTIINSGDHLVVNDDGTGATWKHLSVVDSITIDTGNLNAHSHPFNPGDKDYSLSSLIFGIILNSDLISEDQANYVIEKQQFKGSAILDCIKRDPGAAAMNMVKIAKNSYIKQKLIELRDDLPKDFITNSGLVIDLNELGL